MAFRQCILFGIFFQILAFNNIPNLKVSNRILFGIFSFRYFVRTILQFQFAEALCDISGHDGPLHRCDFSGNKEVGEALSKMLKLGKSRPWQDALEVLTGMKCYKYIICLSHWKAKIYI